MAGKWSRVACSQSLYFLVFASRPHLRAVELLKKKSIKTSVDRLDYLVISAHYMYFNLQDHINIMNYAAMLVHNCGAIELWCHLNLV